MQDLKEEIDIRLSRVQDIKYEPWLLAEDDSRLLQLETQGTPSLAACQSEATGITDQCLSCYSRSFPWGQVVSLASLIGCPIAMSCLVSRREMVSLHSAPICFPHLPPAAKFCRAFSLGFLFARML